MIDVLLGVWAVGSLVAAVLVVGASAAQVAVAQLNAVRLRQLLQRGLPRAEALAAVTRDAAELGSAIALVHLSAVAATLVLTMGAALRLKLGPGAIAAFLLASGLMLLLVQALGRAIGAARPEPVARRLYPPLRAIALLARPWLLLEQAVVRLALRPGLGRVPLVQTTSEEELRALVDAVEETEALEEDEREMIASIFEMSDRDVREIMVPRVDVVALDGATPVETALDLAVSSGHSRFPVFEGDLDHVLGVVHLRDLAASLRAGGQGQPVASLARPLHIIPETKKIDELLHELQALRVQMALVVDEYGGVAGIVTVEDLLEEIVGEIRDEYDTAEEDPIQLLSDREAIMDGGVSIHDANEALPLGLDQEEYETVGGLVYGQLGRVPTPGDIVTLPTCQIKVLATTGRRVRRLQVTLAEQAPA